MNRTLKILSLVVGVASILSSAPVLARGEHSGGGGRSGIGHSSAGAFRSSSHGGHFSGHSGGSFRGSTGHFRGSSFGFRSSGFYRPHRYWGWGYAPLWSSFGWYWGWPYDPWGDSFYGRSYSRFYMGRRYGGASVDGSRYAIVDTDVNPDEAELWLDGKFIGTADDFDGQPDFLYLKPGSKYHLEFKLPGHEGYSVDIDARRGEKVHLDKKLARLPGVGKLDSFTETRKGTPFGRIFGSGGAPANEGEREDRDGWRSRRSERRRPEARVEASREDDDDDMEVDTDETSTVPNRPDAQPGANGAQPKEKERKERIEEPMRGERPRERADSGRASLRWNVKPEDAAIYLDDRYIGTGEDLAGGRRAFVTETGKHTITVVRPGFKTKTLEVEAKPGKALDVEINLEK